MKHKFKYLIEIIFKASITKTLHFNIKYFGITSIFRLPVLIGKKTELRKLSGNVNILSERRFGIQIGMYPLPNTRKNENSIFFNTGTITFNQRATLHQGASIWNQGNINIGFSTTFTGVCEIICRKNITFGDNCLVSWGCQIMDSDHHIIKNENGMLINEDKEIIIENNTWISSYCSILKGTHIETGAIIASGSVLSNKKIPTNSIAVKSGEILRKEIKWE